MRERSLLHDVACRDCLLDVVPAWHVKRFVLGCVVLARPPEAEERVVVYTSYHAEELLLERLGSAKTRVAINVAVKGGCGDEQLLVSSRKIGG